MDKIASFTINHLKLLPGVYVSRRDLAGDFPITTFDIRMTRPNREPVMNTAEIHTIEHLGATFLRNHKLFKDKVLYFGPMGCRTGFYLLLSGDYESADIVPLLQEMFLFIRDYEGDVPGAAAKDCGNYLDMNLPMAKYLAGKFYDEVLEDIREEQLIYPVYPGSCLRFRFLLFCFFLFWFFLIRLLLFRPQDQNASGGGRRMELIF